MKYTDIMSMVGQTPHLGVRSAETPAARIHVKLEGYNPTGSVKDRACLNMRILRAQANIFAAYKSPRPDNSSRCEPATYVDSI